jgi:acetyl esterase/lipase
MMKHIKPGGRPPFDPKIPPMMDVSHIQRKWLDVAYADQSPAQRLDIYLPDAGEAPFPVIYYIHGGAWQICDKRDDQLEPILKGLSRGYAVVAINYRLSGEAIFPAQIYDVKSALRFIKANADQFQLDKNRIAAWGGSAGGHLSALLGTSVGEAELEDLTAGYPDEDTRVRAVVDMFGPNQDFILMDAQLTETGNGIPDHSGKNSPESCFLGKQVTLVPDLVRKASPMTYITEDVPYFYIQHGYHDQLVPYQQSVNFASELQKIAGEDKVILEIFKDHVYHADPYFFSEENLEGIFSFLDLHLQ